MSYVDPDKTYWIKTDKILCNCGMATCLVYINVLSIYKGVKEELRDIDIVKTIFIYGLYHTDVDITTCLHLFIPHQNFITPTYIKIQIQRWATGT